MTPNAATVGEALASARNRLAGSASPGLDAELLLAHALALPRTYVHAWPDAELPATAEARLNELVRRRADGEPVAYLLGRREFWSLDLEVSADVLIPRPETEGLVEIALAHLRTAGRAPAVLDLGTGSGCVAIALARQRPDARVTAADASSAALALARRNAERLGTPIELIEGEWLAPVDERRFDVIVSNPPYVRSDDPHLQRGDVRFEPRAALDGGPDGLDAIHALAHAAGDHLRPGGLLALEHGAEQAEAVRELLTAAGWTGVESRKDWAGLPRFALTHRGQT